MADPAKHLPVGGGSLFSDLKSLFSILRARRTVAFAYGFMFAFVALTFFLFFNPSPNSSSPWFSNIFTSPATTTAPTSDVGSYRSQFSSIFSYFFPDNSSQQVQTGSTDSGFHQVQTFAPPPLLNAPVGSTGSVVQPVFVNNQTKVPLVSNKSPILKPNQTSFAENTTTHVPPYVNSPSVPTQKQGKNSTGNTITTIVTPPAKNDTSKPVKSIGQKGGATNYTASLLKKPQGNKTVSVPVPAPVTVHAPEVPKPKQGNDEIPVESLFKCNFFDGLWVKDDSYPLYKPGSCSLIDEQFNCIVNGRPDTDYHKYRWKPKGCDLPRLNPSHMLEMLRGKRLVFVGDSLNRNMWESLVCMLRNSVKDKSKVYEANGRQHFRGEASYSFIFKDYNCTVEFFVSPFLVREWEMHDKNGTHETLRLDLVGRSCDQYKNADIIVFNTGHWWTHDKTSKGKDYYQEGSHVYGELNVLEAFRKALTTWARWVDANVSPAKSLVFFRGYSASHFSGGQWNSGGQCDHEVQPIKNDTYLREYPPKMEVLERVLKGMKTQVTYLNITRMTDYRKDGHPSIYRKQSLSDAERRSPLRFQDCSHWCLPGVPDAWNEILYAELLVRLYQREQQQKRP